MKYRKLPVEIDAFQMTKERRWDNNEWPEWLHKAWNKEPSEGAVWISPDDPDRQLLAIGTLEGVHKVTWGDYIIKGVKGELYACKPDIFALTYEPSTTTPNIDEPTTREEAIKLIDGAFGRRPDFPSGQDYVDDVRGHTTDIDEAREAIKAAVNYCSEDTEGACATPDKDCYDCHTDNVLAAIQDKYVLKADKAAYPKCTMCYDTGWVFEAKLDKDGNFRDGKLTLEVLPCLLPDCKVSDTPVELVSLETMKLSTVTRHPKDGYVMSIAALTHREASE